MSDLNNAVTKIDNATLAQMDVDALLELDINAIEEVADFVAMPTGQYRFVTGLPAVEEIGAANLKAIVVPFKLTACVALGTPECVEDADQIANSFADGATVEHTERFTLQAKDATKKSAYGTRAFATLFKGLIPEGQTANLRELMELAAGTTGEVIIEKTSFTKEGATEPSYSSRIKVTTVMFD